MDKPTLPNFIIIGASRSGTTSLYHYLRQHPQIYMSPVKETNYFAYDSKYKYSAFESNRFKIRTFDQYTDLFNNVASQNIIGEASPRYLSTPFAAKRIYDMLPQVKILAILRNPVQRVYAAYLGKVRRFRESQSFADYIDSEINICTDQNYANSILYPGLYYTNLKRYIDQFDSNNLKIHIFEDFVSDIPQFYCDVLRYLGLNTDFKPDFSINYNPSGLPKYKALDILLKGNIFTKWVKMKIPYFFSIPLYKQIMRLQSKSLYKPVIDESTRKKLISFYEKEIVQLEGLIGRDLSAWLE